MPGSTQQRMSTDNRMDARLIRLSAGEAIRCRGFLKQISDAFSKEYPYTEGGHHETCTSDRTRCTLAMRLAVEGVLDPDPGGGCWRRPPRSRPRADQHVRRRLRPGPAGSSSSRTPASSTPPPVSRSGAAGRPLWLAEDAIWLTVVGAKSQGAEEEGATAASCRLSTCTRVNPEPPPRQAVNLRLSFPGANPHPVLEPFDRLETHVSYFIGDDPAKWRADVPVWGGVRYRDLYPGLDLEITGENGQWSWRLIRNHAVRNARKSGAHCRQSGCHPARRGRGRGGSGRGRFAPEQRRWVISPCRCCRPPDRRSKRPRLPACPRRGSLRRVSAVCASRRPQPATSRRPRGHSPYPLLYATFLGGSGWDRGYGIAVEAPAKPTSRAKPARRTSLPASAPATTPASMAAATPSSSSWTRPAPACSTPPSSAAAVLTTATASPWTAPARPTSRARPGQRTSRPASAPATTPATTAARTPSSSSWTRPAPACSTPPSSAAASDDDGRGIAVDTAGQAYVTG